MREAFPSLPSGSPSIVHRAACRRDRDTASDEVDHHHDQLQHHNSYALDSPTKRTLVPLCRNATITANHSLSRQASSSRYHKRSPADANAAARHVKPQQPPTTATADAAVTGVLSSPSAVTTASTTGSAVTGHHATVTPACVVVTPAATDATTAGTAGRSSVYSTPECAGKATATATHPGDLEELQSVLQFPEEVALRITDAEYQLFYRVPPINFMKHVILVQQNEKFPAMGSRSGCSPAAAAAATTLVDEEASATTATSNSPDEPAELPVWSLLKRFDEVCSWVSHVICLQTNHDERRAVFACLLRAAMTCWNIGNFNGAMQITIGLRSPKLKMLVASFADRGKIPVLEFLSAAIESAEYERALTRGLQMPDCRVIPCFKKFLNELDEIMSSGHFSLNSSSPMETIDFDGSISPRPKHFHIATETTPNRAQFRFSDSRKESSANLNPSKVLRRQVYIPDYSDGDEYFKKMTSSGLITQDQVYKLQAVIDHIGHCHRHHQSLLNESTPSLMEYLRTLQPRQVTATTYHPELEELEEDYEVEIGNYNPVQPIVHDHGVSLIPISSSHHKIDHHILQLLHHGTTAVLWEPDIPSDRSRYVYVRLERSCGLITWHRPSWRRLNTHHEFNVAVNPEELLPPRQNARPQTTGGADGGEGGIGGGGMFAALEEGSLDLSSVKDIMMGSRNRDNESDLLAAGRRYGLTHTQSCVSILYGSALNDNRELCLMCPPMLSRVWFVCLSWIVKGIRRQQNLADRSMLWLKEQYIQLYFEDAKCSEPLAADAIRVFGGRDWHQRKMTVIGGGGLGGGSSFSGNASTSGDSSDGSMRRESSIKFKKKRSVVNLLTQATQGASASGSLADCDGRDSLRMRCDRRRERIDLGVEKTLQHSKHFRIGSITIDTQLDFLDFIALFRSFGLLARKDLRELFDQLSVMRKSKSRLNSEKSRSAPELCAITGQRRIGLLTRNSSLDTEYTDAQCAQKKCFDAIAASSILNNCAGVDTADMQVITYSTLQKFLETRQMETKTEEEVKQIIKRHEPDRTLRIEGCLSFEGFSRFMMDKDNYAFVNERVIQSTSNMDRPLSQYYIASSHNTYLTGHQLKGESSSELYSQVLLTGCRCVELDCWDGEDGAPVIYHGHTFTTKISFKSVVEAINKSAFVASPYPIVLSIENHCSLQQQSRMAQMFQSTFGEKLVTKFLFESDYNDESMLPSPAQLKHRILIKNKKLVMDIPFQLVGQSVRNTPQRQPTVQQGRASSIVSTQSANSAPEEFSDDEYDDDDEYDNIDEKTFHTIFGSMDEHNSRHSLSSFTTTSSRRHEIDDKTKKRSSSQIARELSDMVNYIQAIKFRGLNPIQSTASNYTRQQSQASVSSAGSTAAVVTVGSILKTNTSMPPIPPTPPMQHVDPKFNANGTTSTTKDSSSSTVALSSTCSTVDSPASSTASARKLLHQPNVNSRSFQCSSINEASAKKLCRKHSLNLIGHTESQLMRTYPAGLRIDSSNFNPVFFWAFGIQMVALNYQTDDQSMHINTAMFEENGGCGFVCKPDVLWDRTHLMYRRFNPLEKQFDGLHSSQIVINIVSGQYVSQMTQLMASTYVEVEMLGIPIDCAKRRTKVIRRNGLNPIWNDTFFFKCMFYNLAFLKFCVHDADTHSVLSQRVIPLKCLRPGYRHVRLRSAINKPLSMASLFVYSRVEEESLERAADVEERGDTTTGSVTVTADKTHASALNATTSSAAIAQLRSVSLMNTNIPLRRRMFFLSVYGVVNDEPYTILKITQESTTREVIVQALQKANRQEHSYRDYILIEEVHSGWEKKDMDSLPTLRILDMSEMPLQSQSRWRGDGRFILKRIGDDPSSRAWLSSIRSVAERRSLVAGGGGEASGTGDTSDDPQAGTFWDDTDSFLVCIYNVSPDIPYAILKVPLSATAQDVLAQSLVKARRMEEPSRFILVEELEFGGGTSATGSSGSTSATATTTTQQRTVLEDENVFRTQANWKTIGRFVLQERAIPTPSMSRHRQAIELIKNLSMTPRAGSVSSASKAPIQVALSDPVTSSRSRQRGSRGADGSVVADTEGAAGGGCDASTSGTAGPSASSGASTSQMARGIFRAKGNSEKETPSGSPRQKQREVHSEGETLSDDESRDRADILSTVSRIKKMSMKKLKAWKS